MTKVSERVIEKRGRNEECLSRHAVWLQALKGNYRCKIPGKAGSRHVFGKEKDSWMAIVAYE